MSDEKAANALFMRCYSLERPARDEVLDRHCHDPKLRQIVQELLDAYDDDVVTLGTGLEPSEFERGLDPPAPSIRGFEILREIGRGGMGIVYLANDLTLGRSVAIKCIGGLGTNEQLESEAQAAGGLRHSGIVPVHAIGSVDGRPYIVMAYIEGCTLREALRDARKSHTALSCRRWVAELLSQIAEAVNFAHQHDCIHNDLKPSNILIDDEGKPYVTDFGIARTELAGGGETSHVPAGTYAYMSPEQATGKETDARSDVFSLGTILYESLTNVNPFRAENPVETLDRVRRADPTPVRQHDRSIPRDLATICARAMEADPNGRYQRASQLADDLHCFLDDKPILAQPPSWEYRTLRFLRRRRRQLFVVLLVLGALALGSLLFSGPGRLMTPITIRTPGIDNAGVYWRPLDPSTGELSDSAYIGRTPLSTSFEPGQGRLVVVKDGDFAEIAVEFVADEHQALDVLIRPAADVRAGMVRVDAAGSPFWIDLHEVTNEQYREFVVDTGHLPPPLWSNGAYPAAWTDLPVVGDLRGRIGVRALGRKETANAARVASGGR